MNATRSEARSRRCAVLVRTAAGRRRPGAWPSVRGRPRQDCAATIRPPADPLPDADPHAADLAAHGRLDARAHTRRATRRVVGDHRPAAGADRPARSPSTPAPPRRQRLARRAAASSFRCTTAGRPRMPDTPFPSWMPFTDYRATSPRLPRARSRRPPSPSRSRTRGCRLASAAETRSHPRTPQPSCG